MRKSPVVSCSMFFVLVSLPATAQQLRNDQLVVTVNAREGSYQLQTRAGESRTVLNARAGAQIEHQWVRSSDYPERRAAESTFSDDLGAGHQISVTCSGLEGTPDLVYVLQLYDRQPYGAIQVKLENHMSRPVTVQAIRSVEAIGQPPVDLGARDSADRVLSDSFSEDWPNLVIYDLGQPRRPMHRGVGSQLIFNRESRQSLFLGALTSDRFLTILHLGFEGSGDDAKIASFTADATGTTEIQKENSLRRAAAEEQIELSLPLKPAGTMASERLMMEAGADYHAQLLAYGDAIRRLHHARVSSPNLIGWWSWTSYYMLINEGAVLTNAQWLASHLKSLGYQYLQIDEGYQYARGEYATANATQFPRGMRYMGDEIRRQGLTFGMWTAPFEVTNRAWIYENHKDWLVHTADGKPISVGATGGQNGDTLYALDATHPDAQEYMRQTYRTLVREWGVRYIKLDFMDTVAIEGYRYRPDTTALEAQRIGLEVIRKAVGEYVVLDKDGSPMLNPVGIVDAGRISADTAHTFQNTKTVAPGIAARFYMHRNFFINDPDAFNICQNVPAPRRQARPLTLAEAQASIMLSAISGGMYEIGDDLPMLGAEKDRLALVENPDLINIAKLSRAFTPIDLLSYDAEDGQPSVFFLREDQRQSVLAVYNWTENTRSHTLKLDTLGLAAGHPYRATDVLNPDEHPAVEGGGVRLDDQPPHSVRVIKLIDSRVPAKAPSVAAEVPPEARVGEPVKFSAQTQASGVPALSYRWDFGDGTSAEGPAVSHAYTRSADFTVRLTADGLDGVPAQQSFLLKITGTLGPQGDLSKNRRYMEPPDH